MPPSSRQRFAARRRFSRATEKIWSGLSGLRASKSPLSRSEAVRLFETLAAIPIGAFENDYVKIIGLYPMECEADLVQARGNPGNGRGIARDVEDSGLLRQIIRNDVIEILFGPGSEAVGQRHESVWHGIGNQGR